MGKKAFIALGLTAGRKTPFIHLQRTRAILPYTTETVVGSHACVALRAVKEMGGIIVGQNQ